MKKLMIIDGSSLLYRAFFALPPLSNALGVPTNAVYGFLTMLVKLYNDLHPDYVAVAFDKGKETFRTELYADYKGNRPNAPDDLRPQFGLIREVLEALGISVIEQEGYEGDDIIGSLSKKLGNKDTAVYIITGDRDSLQLVDEYSTVFLTKKGISDMLEVRPNTMADEYGYGPDQVIDMKALMGDSSDNIPGVPGVGEKTALKLLSEYGTLEGVYENIEAIKGKLKEKLADNKELAFLSRTLATIKTDMDLAYTLEDFVTNAHETEIVPLFDCLGFHNVTPRLIKAMGLTAPAPTDSESLFAAFAESPTETKVAVTTLSSEAVTAEFYTNKVLAFHIMPAGSHPFRTIATAYVSNGDAVAKLVGDDKDTQSLVATMLQEAKGIVTEDAKLLMEVTGESTPGPLALFDENQEPRVWDVTLMAYLADPTRTNYGISYLCERFGSPVVPASGDDAEFVATVEALLAMKSVAVEVLTDNGLWDLYKTIELPLIRTLLVMEKNGIYIDKNALETTQARFETEATELRDAIYKEAGEEFNINSPKQLGVILFEKLNLPVIKKTKTGYSTNADVLDVLRNEHPIIELILKYRTVVKLISTYLEGLKPLIDSKTGRIHSTFNQMVTATGRLSSSDPNLQNIPVRTEKGREIRALFLPGKGYDTLVSADYSQIELRILAHLSEDPALIKAFLDGEDIHRFTAAEVLGKSIEDVTPTERSHAKAVNFGIIYGISDFGLSRDLGITRGEAKDYIELYFSRYPKVKAYMDAMVAEAHETGMVRTMFGRVRALPDINSRNFNRRSFAERTAMNTPIQGSAADIIKLAMNQVAQRLEQERLTSRLLLQVHDELVLEVVKGEEAKVEALLAEIMDSVVALKVPLIVDVHSATNWADVK
ncbi:DNA polymerase I [Veillonella sp. R32]|uniref:DNA polymerase I n=1 Tax=Veillonella sp. R32 TaxID=2021312 RepID=UPI001389F0B1|nr:DNA polymerase I [Veillonella sp. R32]KAF1682972.1 DNA polymerase I [Veillonella sp. R32]